MPKATPINSWKNILEEVGQKPSPKEWEEKYGIPEGTPWKRAAAIRLYVAIIEEKAYHLLPKLFEFMEPSTKKVEVDVTDWRQQIELLGVPIEIVAERLRLVLAQTVEEKWIEPQRRTDFEISASATRVEEPRSLELDSSERPADEPSHPNYSDGTEPGQVSLDSDAETKRTD